MRLRHCAGLALVALAGSGCATLGSISWSDIFKPKPPAPPAEAPCVVTEGHRVEKVASALSFRFTPARDGSAELEDVAVYAVGPPEASWGGGNTPRGSSVYTVRVNAYDRDHWKIKAYGLNWYCDEKKLAVGWRAGATYAVKLETLPDRVRLTVDGVSQEIPCPAPAEVLIGYGWPPQKRQGALGAKIEGAEFK